MSSIGQFIKNTREATGLSQKKLGAMCDLSDSEIMKIENGSRQKPNWDNLCKIAKALNIKPYRFLQLAGYINEEDIKPIETLTGLDKLTASDLELIQQIINTLVKKNDALSFKEGV